MFHLFSILLAIKGLCALCSGHKMPNIGLITREMKTCLLFSCYFYSVERDNIDKERNVSCVQPPPPASSPANEKAAIGGSNADRLANSAATVGGQPRDAVTSGGWILTTAAVTAILPEIEAYCNTMPADSPVVICTAWTT
jgi:hypothetical protein